MAGEIECGRWIPVSERLPPFDEDVLVLTDEGCHVCAYRLIVDPPRPNAPSSGNFEREDMKVFDGVTYWMPLPEPPWDSEWATDRRRA